MGYKYQGSNRFVLSVYVMFMFCILAFRSVTFSHTGSHLNLITSCFREAYTGLPVVRITENQKALNCVVLNYSIPVSEE